MRYFFIYSGGGGAGDWNGLNRVWLNFMPVSLKSSVLLKFGDIFFNHSPQNNRIPLLIRSRWDTINDFRQWLFNRVNDEYVLNNTYFLLDSGTSKIVNYVTKNHPEYTERQIIDELLNQVNQNNLLMKYAEIIQASNINEAVTFDFPNLFKRRTQSGSNTNIVFSQVSTLRLLRESANYANELYGLLGNQQNRLLTTINGLWSIPEIESFLELLNYEPNKLAVGGLTRANAVNFANSIQNINTVFDLQNFERVHFLGCGGKQNARIIKNLGYNFDHISVDCSTPYNRAIDGNVNGTSQSAYVDYINLTNHRITPNSLEEILNLHRQPQNPVFTQVQMQDILEGISQHQMGNSDYESRAKLYIHNSDAFRVNAL